MDPGARPDERCQTRSTPSNVVAAAWQTRAGYPDLLEAVLAQGSGLHARYADLWSTLLGKVAVNPRNFF